MIYYLLVLKCLKNYALILGLFLGVTGFSSTIKLTKKDFSAVTPNRTISISNYLNDMPLDAIYSFNGESLQIKAHNFGVNAGFFSNNFIPGKQSIDIQAKSLSDFSVKMSVKVSMYALHFKDDNCVGSTHKKIAEFDVKFGKKKSVYSFPFEITNDDVRCPHCDQVLHNCRFLISIKLKTPKSKGVEISSLNVNTLFKTFSYNKINKKNISSLVKSLNDEKKKEQKWRNEKRKYFNNHTQNNHFDITQFLSKADKSLQLKFAYFSEDELKKLNPDFEVKKIASWPFYQYAVYYNTGSHFYDFPQINEAFICGGNVYAATYDTLFRQNHSSLLWEVVATESPKWDKERKSFPNDVKLIGNYNHKLIRLSDGAKISTVGNISLNRGKAVITEDKIYYIDNTRKKIISANNDFSQKELLKFSVPIIENLKILEIRNIYGTDNGRRLLIEYFVKYNYNRFFVWAELDLKTAQCCFKSPINPNFSQFYIYDNNWMFSSAGKVFCDLGKNLPFYELKTVAKNSLAKYAEILRNSILVGNYAVVSNKETNSIIWVNLTNVKSSLKVNGFELFRKVTRLNNNSILITMPDALYSVTRLSDAGKLIAKPPVNRLKDKLENFITNIEVYTPALFDAQFDNNNLRFELNKTSGTTQIMLELNLPEAPENQIWCFQFNSNIENLFEFEGKMANGKSVICYSPDGNILRIRGNVKTLYIKLVKSADRQELTTTLQVKNSSLDDKEKEIKNIFEKKIIRLLKIVKEQK